MASTQRIITIRTAAVGGGAYSAFVDETAGDVIAGFKAAMRALVQNEPLYGSETPFIASRGNRGFTLSFSVSRVHTDPEAAASFLRDHPASIPDQLDLKIVQGAVTSYAAAAALETIEPDEPTGRSTTIHYTFACPTFNSTAP